MKKIEKDKIWASEQKYKLAICVLIICLSIVLSILILSPIEKAELNAEQKEVQCHVKIFQASKQPLSINCSTTCEVIRGYQYIEVKVDGQ